MKVDNKVKAEVKATLNEFTAAYEERKLNKLAGLFVANSEVVTLGAAKHAGAAKQAGLAKHAGAAKQASAAKQAGASELKARFEQDWAQREAGALKFGATEISLEGSIAYVQADTVLHMKGAAGEEKVNARFTAGLERQGDKWKFNQMRFSLPDSHEAAGYAARGHAAAGHAAAGRASAGHSSSGYSAGAYAAEGKAKRLEK